MPQIPNKTVVTYQGRWVWPGIGTSALLHFQKISQLLTSAGLPVRQYNIDAPFFIRTEFDVNMQIEVENGLGFANENDVISIIRHFVLQQTGYYPITDSIVTVQLPGKPKTQTGSPGSYNPGNGNGTPEGCVSGQNIDTTGDFSLSCWFSNLTTKGLTTLGMVGLLLLLGLVLLAYSGVGPIVASAARKR